MGAVGFGGSRLRIAECQSRIHLRPTSARRVGTDEQGFYRRETEETETSADTKIFYLFGKVRKGSGTQEKTGGAQNATRKRRLRAEKGFYSGLLGIARDYSGLLRIAGCNLTAFRNHLINACSGVCSGTCNCWIGNFK